MFSLFIFKSIDRWNVPGTAPNIFPPYSAISRNVQVGNQINNGKNEKKKKKKILTLSNRVVRRDHKNSPT